MSNSCAMQGIAVDLACHYRPSEVAAKIDHDVVAFMRCIQVAVKVTRPVEFEELMVREEVFAYREGRKIKKWVAGHNAPSFDSTMRLLRRAGFLTPDALACLDAQA